MKFLNLARIAMLSVLVLGLAIMTAIPSLAQNNNTGTTGNIATMGNRGNTVTTGNTGMMSNSGTATSNTNTTMSTATPVQTSGNTNRTERVETRTEHERGFPWGLLGLLGLAGLIPRKRKEVEVHEFRDTRGETRENRSTSDNQTNT